MASSILFSGCSLDPYVHAPSPRPGFVPNTELQRKLDESTYQYQPGTTNLKTSYVSIDAARAYAQFVADAYENALSKRSMTRSALNLGTLAGALTSIGVGIAGGSEDIVLGAGLTSAALGISGQLLITKDHETAYALGAKSIQCVLTAATNARTLTAPLILVETKKYILSRHLDYYKQAVHDADMAAKGKTPADTALHQKKMSAAKQIIETTELNINNADRLMQAINILGEQLVNKVEEIRWTVNDAVRRAEPDILVLDKNLDLLFVSRIQGLGVSIPGGAQLATVPPQPAYSLGEDIFTNQDLKVKWDQIGKLGDEIVLTDTPALTNALNTAIEAQNNAPVAFVANLFQGCAINANELPSGTAEITLSPASHSIASGQAQVVYANINGGSVPFVVKASGVTDAPTVTGRLLKISIKAEEAKPNAQIVVEVSDLYGKQANFIISVPAEQPAAAGGGNEDKIKTKVTEAQTALGFIKDDPNKNLDGAIGPQTRKAIIDYLKDADRIGTLTTMINSGKSAENYERCTKLLPITKTKRLKLGGTIDNSTVTAALDGLYTEVLLESTSEVKDIDEPLLDFFLGCKADLALPNE